MTPSDSPFRGWLGLAIGLIWSNLILIPMMWVVIAPHGGLPLLNIALLIAGVALLVWGIVVNHKRVFQEEE
jgi:hypothetical protein